MFKPVDTQKNLSDVEKEQIKYWNENDIFEKSVEQNQDNEKFVFFDGPPFANGLPHYGHILGMSLKDAVTRYWSMKGYYTPRANGWDCHGLPVEYEIEKSLEISGHKEITKFGIDKFNATCRASVFKYTSQWEELLERLGRWIDLENGYATLQNDYMESIWWVFNSIWEKGLVYKGLRPMHICPRCETPLSNFEVTQGYKDITDLSATVKFELIDEPNTFLLAWTTTPWTLPANQGLAMNPNVEYLKVSYEGSNYVVAKELHAKVFADKDSEILGKFNPKEWEDKKYKPLFNYYEGKDDRNYVICLADFVSTESGTGIVHVAGGFGEDDYKLVKEKGMQPLLNIGMDGIYFDEVTDFAGKFVKGQDQNINKHLEEKGLLFKQENYRHSYPHCWRCDTPLLNYSLAAWFIEVTKIQDKLIENNKEINWQPDHIREGRFGKWLENVRDWNVSRNRFWGCPMPIWESKSGKQICANSIKTIRDLSKDGNNLFIVRHGEAEHNLLKITSSKQENTRDLSEKGQSQVLEQAAHLKDKKIDIIYHSPFHRTTQTAEILAKELGVSELITDNRLQEFQIGLLEGAACKSVDLELNATENFYSHKMGKNGESLQDVEARLLKFIDSLSIQHEGKNILIVTHRDPIRALNKYYNELETKEEILAKIPHEQVLEFYSGKVPVNPDGELDLHKPYIDDIILEKDGENYTRISEVFDCWFESGSMPYAQIHYPFENKKEFEQNFPANFIAEGLDQTRGWFYTLHVISTALFDKPAFKNVIVNGTLLSQSGEKLSKSKKNYPDPSMLFESKGVDALRLFLYQSTAALGEDIRFYEDAVDEVMKKFSLTLWNTYSFFVTYANIDNFKPEEHSLDLSKMHELDRWLLSELNELIDEVTTQMDKFNLSKATRPLLNFVDNLSNWYIRRSRRRFWKSENDEQKYLAYKTLHTVLVEFTKLAAPFTPFITDEIFRNITNEKSVHLAKWPESNPEFIDSDLNYKMKLARTIVKMGHSLRAKENLKVRQPLSMIQIAVPKASDSQHIQELKEVICEELNIKSIVEIDNPEELTNQSLKPKARELGKILGSKMKEVINAARNGEYKIQGDKVEIANESIDLKYFEVQFSAKEGYSAEAEDGIVVILDTTITEDLKKEGLVREAVRYIQDFRKEIDLEVNQTIYLFLKTNNKELEEAITEHADYIKKETLSIELQQSGDFEWDSEKYVSVNGEELTLAIRKS